MDSIDEIQPLLKHAEQAQANHAMPHPTRIVDFSRDGDPENPIEWPRAYKWSIVALLALMAFTVTFTCICVVPVANLIIADLEGGQARKSTSVLLVTIWELGEAAGPLLIAPLSELVGRYKVLNAANVLFVAATALAALAPSSALLIVARFLTGLAVASNVLNPAVVGDLFAPEQRGAAMSLVMLTPLIGGAVGPAASGAIVERLSWRAILWISAAAAGACELAFLLFLRETYKKTILARRARKLRRETGDLAIRSVFEIEDLLRKDGVWESVLRPFVIMYSSSVLQIITVAGGVVYAYFYIMSTTLTDILEYEYGLSPTLCGFSFVCFSIGSAVSVVMCNLFLDSVYVRLGKANKGVSLPEHRLPFAIAGAFVFPIFIALYGWIPQAHLALSAELTMVGLWGFAFVLVELPLAAYVVDAFGLYSASAMTAMIVTRCVMGTFLPMAVSPLVKRIGWGWGMSVFAAISLAMTPTIIAVMRYGARWRQRSPYSQDSH